MQCDTVYTGQIGRAIKNRISGPIAKLKDTTGFADHCIKNIHYLDQHQH